MTPRDIIENALAGTSRDPSTEGAGPVALVPTNENRNSLRDKR